MLPSKETVVSTKESHAVDDNKHTVTKDAVTTQREYVVEKVVVKRKKKLDDEGDNQTLTTAYESTRAENSTGSVTRRVSRNSNGSWRPKSASQHSLFSPSKRTSRHGSEHSPVKGEWESKKNQMPPEGASTPIAERNKRRGRKNTNSSGNQKSFSRSNAGGGSGKIWRKKQSFPLMVGDEPTEEHDPLKAYEKTFIQPSFLPRGSQLLSPEEASRAEKIYQNIDEYVTELRDNPQEFNLPDAFEKQATTVETKEEMDAVLKDHNYGIVVAPGSKLQDHLSKIRTPMRQLVLKPADFESPAEEKLVRGGQNYYILRYDAKWFRVRPGLLGGIWIGHDLEDELMTLDFYDSLSVAAKEDPNWMFFAKGGTRKFGGIIRMKCMMHNEQVQTRNLFLTQNFFSGYVQLRKVDFLIGKVTAISGWRGTSSVKAWGEKKASLKSSSRLDDCRAESMSFPSESLVLHLNATSGMNSAFTLKMVGVKQSELGHMRLYQLIPYIFDLREGGNEAFKRSEEYVHATCVRMVNSMYNFTKALGQIKTPQKWISTIVSLGFDASSDEMRWRKTEIRAHSWKMSTMTTHKEFLNLTDKEQDEQEMLWDQYKRGINNIEWEMMRYTYHRTLCPSWNAVIFELENAKTGELLAYALQNNVDPATHTVGWHFKNEKLESSHGNHNFNKGKGKARRGKRTVSTVKVYKISGNYRLLLMDILNLPSEITKVKHIGIHCIVFQWFNEALTYFNILKRREDYAKPFQGRIFSQPSRVFSFDNKDNKVCENYFFSESIIKTDMRSFDRNRFFESPFPPHLRDLGILGLEETKTAAWAHNTRVGKFSVYQKRASTESDLDLAQGDPASGTEDGGGRSEVEAL